MLSQSVVSESIEQRDRRCMPSHVELFCLLLFEGIRLGNRCKYFENGVMHICSQIFHRGKQLPADLAEIGPQARVQYVELVQKLFKKGDGDHPSLRTRGLH